MVAGWVLAGSVPAERESTGQGIIASSTTTRVRPCPEQCPRREGRSYTCLNNGKLERNIGECAGSGVLSHSPAERLGVELEFEEESPSSNGSGRMAGMIGSIARQASATPTDRGEPRTAELNTLHSSKILEAPEKGRSESAALVEFEALQFFVQVDHQIVLQQTPVVVPVKRN